MKKQMKKQWGFTGVCTDAVHYRLWLDGTQACCRGDFTIWRLKFPRENTDWQKLLNEAIASQGLISSVQSAF